MAEKEAQQQPEQTQITAEQFMVNKTIDNLANANANQALEIANLKAQIQLMQQQQQQQASPQEPPSEKTGQELEGDLIPKDKKKVEH